MSAAHGYSSEVVESADGSQVTIVFSPPLTHLNAEEGSKVALECLDGMLFELPVHERFALLLGLI